MKSKKKKEKMGERKNARPDAAIRELFFYIAGEFCCSVFALWMMRKV